MSVAEKILYVQHLWDRIAENPDGVELSDAQREELDARLERMKDTPERGNSWENIRERLTQKG